MNKDCAMAFRGSCGECSPYVGGVAVGVYTTAVYLTASGLELGWIIETEVRLPPAAYILTAEYFCSLFLALFLMVGLLLRNTKYLLVWLVMMMVFFFPECGLVMYMSLYHWGLSSPRGLAEFIFYVCRAVFNILSIVCIHWLQATWRREAHVLQRLQTLHVGSLFSEIDTSSSKTDPEPNSNVHFSHEIFYTSSRCHESEMLYMTTGSNGNEKSSLVKNQSPSPAPPPPPPSVASVTSRSRGGELSPACFCHKPGSSEFDATSFNEYLSWKLQQQQPTSHNSPIRSSQSDIMPASKSKPWNKSNSAFYNPAFSDTQSVYSTHSLERLKHAKSQSLRRVHSLGDISAAPDIYVLQTLPQEPFHYIQRQASIIIDDADSTSSHSIRDVAL